MSEEKLTVLEQARADYLDKLRKVKLAEAGVDISDVETYSKYISADKPAEIEAEAQAIVADIKQRNTMADVRHDNRKWNPFGE